MAIHPGARWRGPVPNKTPRAMVRPIRGLVLHVEVGTEEGTNSWFHNPAAQASAHFGVAKNGALDQWVDTNDKAWAEANYNPFFLSVETEGMPGEALTDAQVETLGLLLGFLARQEGFPIQITHDPKGRGFITHGELGSPGGSHYGCPGNLRKAQMERIVEVALGHAQPVVVQPAPANPKPIDPIPTDDVQELVTMMPITKQGDNGQFVRILQGLLIANGRSVAVDGAFGPGTAGALREWQGACGLDADGVAGPKTWRRLLCV